MDPINSEHVDRDFFNASLIMRELFENYAQLFNPLAVKSLIAAWDCSPPLVLPSVFNLRPLSMNRCKNRASYGGRMLFFFLWGGVEPSS